MTPELIGLTVCLILGTYIQSTLGFGLNLLLTPFALLLLPGYVPVPALVANGVVSLIVAARYRGAIHGRTLKTAMLWSIPGTLLGIGLLQLLSPSALGILGAVVVLAAVAATVYGLGARLGGEPIRAAGVVSGLLASTTSVTGPPLAVALHGEGPAHRRATIAACGVLLTLTSLVGVAFIHPSQLHDNFLPIALSLPGIAIGLLVAARFPRLIPPHTQRFAALGIAAAAALILLIRSIWTLTNGN